MLPIADAYMNPKLRGLSVCRSVCLSVCLEARDQSLVHCKPVALEARSQETSNLEARDQSLVLWLLLMIYVFGKVA